MSIIQQLDELRQEMDKGAVTEDKLNKFVLLSAQEMIRGQEVKSGDDLLKLDKANLVAMLDSMAFLLFYPSWEIQTFPEAQDVTTEEKEEG